MSDRLSPETIEGLRASIPDNSAELDQASAIEPTRISGAVPSYHVGWCPHLLYPLVRTTLPTLDSIPLNDPIHSVYTNRTNHSYHTYEAMTQHHPARIIALVNQKGGPGKTTLTMHLASELSRREARVLVADADPQGTATRWAATAPDDIPFPAAVAGLGGTGARLHRELRKYLEPYDFIVVDCPPSADSPLSHSALLVADLALVPVIPSPPDLWAGIAIRQVIANVCVINETLKTRLIVNQCKPRTRLAIRTLELLPRYGIPVLQTQIGDREAFRHAAAAGLTVADLPRAAKAAEEISMLTDEVLIALSGRGSK